MQRWRLFGYEKYEQTDRAVESEEKETRALDEHIKNLPKAQMEILMTDDTRGTLHGLLHVRAPEDVRIPRFKPQLYPTLRQSREESWVRICDSRRPKWFRSAAAGEREDGRERQFYDMQSAASDSR